MPSPSSSLATLRPDLSGSLMEFDLAADRQGFIGYRVLPVLDVAVESDTFGKIPIEQLLKDRSAAIARAPGAGYSRDTFTFDKDTYATEEYGHEEVIDRRQRRMYANYFDAEQVATVRAYDAVLREAEKRVAALVFNTSTWTGASLTTAVGTAWSTVASAKPIDDVAAAKAKVWDGTGLWPNALIISRKVWMNLRRNDQIIDAIEGNGAGQVATQRQVSLAMVADALDLDFILVGGSAKNAAKEGQSISISSVWSTSYAMVCRIATSNDIQEPCIGRTFHWTEDGSQIGGTVETYYEEKVRSDITRVRHDVDEKILYAELGHLLSNIT